MKRQKGFTLIELMLVVAIIAILSAIAIPSYNQYVLASQRTVAKNTLMDIANRQETFFANNKTYTSSLTNLGLSDPYYVDENGSTTAANALYAITLASATTTFTATATPQNAVASDATCGIYTLDQSEGKTFSKGGSVDDCW